MFAGLLGLERHSSSLLHRCEVKEGGSASGSAGNTSRKRLHRRPGYMRGEQPRQESGSPGEDEEEEEEEGCVSLRNGKSGRHINTTKLTCSSLHTEDCLSVTTSSHSSVNCNGTYQSQPSLSKTELRSNNTPKSPLAPGAASSKSFQTPFNSSFSFIQQSLNSTQDLDPTPESLNDTTPHVSPATLSLEHSNPSKHVQSLLGTDREEQPLGPRFWRDGLWGDRAGITSDDSQSADDTEVTSSLSVDSDTASASSVTSGYESATPASTEQGWEHLVKKYDGVLQECLQNNRTHTKIESMMLKVQRLQQKAILDDDYDAAERFGKKLEELCRERGALRLGLPSRQPSVAQFLERLSLVVNSALQRTDCAAQNRESAESEAGEQSDFSQGPLLCRDRLIQEKKLVEAEILELQQRLTELKDRSRCLEQRIQREEQQVEAEELETSVLKSCSVSQLCDLSQTLQDLVTSENRTQISVSPPPSMLRLQEQEQALNLSIKEVTAKVVMSQRLGSSLRRKVSETETQLLALHEAKLDAISGNDFSSAKELKAEIKTVYQERDRLEALTKRLHSLCSGSSQELAAMKGQRQQLRQELEQRQAHHESQLKDNATKYIELLEDRLQSYGCPGLERIWEADLEACHLFLRGLQLRTPSVSGADVEDLQPTTLMPQSQNCSGEEEEEEDCAMLTALGGRWCPEANLQNSEFTKKLEEFLFGMEDNAPEDGCTEAEAADLTEQCELISDRLMTLEDELQAAIQNRDQALTQSLEKEVQEVKTTLQTMLAQLQENEEEEEEDVNKLQDDDLMENGIEDEEEEEGDEEDQYFSDSWDI